MIPNFDEAGTLPPGIHIATWDELSERFGHTPHRKKLLAGLKSALDSLAASGCRTAFINGSFVTAKKVPKDFDACWDIDGVDPDALDPVLLEFGHGRRAQKAKSLGELFPGQMSDGESGKTFLEFFQIDRETGGAKGIVQIDLRRLP